MGTDEPTQDRGRGQGTGDGFYYGGFTSPNGTIVPDDVFDVLLPRLSEAELRVLLYIIRRTFGFKREADAISLSQLVDGITTTDRATSTRPTVLCLGASPRPTSVLVASKVT